MPPPDPNLPPWKRVKTLPVVFVLALFALVWWRGNADRARKTAAASAGFQTEQGMTVLRGPIFGTRYMVKVGAALPDARAKALKVAVDAELQRVDVLMSTYKPDSELSRFNALPPGKDMTLSKPTAEVLALALQVGRESLGAFDVTVGPLVDAWGFGAGKRAPPGQAPDAATLARLKGLIGGREVLHFDPETRVAHKKKAGVRVDLSAVAKGYGVDRVVARLQREGVANALVEVGGEVRTLGQRPDGEPWRLGIEQPDPAGGGVARVVALRDRALATSGDYRNFREVDGKRVSHTINPVTGRPITHRLASVSVLAATCAKADAWATALNVLGPDQGMKLAEARDMPVFMLVRDDKGAFVGRASKDWPAVSAK